MNRVDEIAQAKGIPVELKGYAVREVCQITGYSKHVIYRAIKSGELTLHYPVSTQVRNGRITSDELQRWVDSL